MQEVLVESPDPDIILPFPTHTARDLRNEIGAIHGGMLQVRTWLDRSLRADQESRLSVDARLGGVDRRLDQYEAQLAAIEQKLDALIGLLTPTD